MRGGRADDFNDITNTSTPTYPASVGGGGGRKKCIGVRSWLVLNSSGQSQPKEEGKHAIMRRTGIPVRDLRILDPLLSYPSTVLGRERAIVLNLEHIKAIITAQEVWLLNSTDPSVSPFIEELQRRILCHRQGTKPQVIGETKEEQNSEGELHTRIDPAQAEAGTPKSSADQGSEAKKDAKQRLENRDGSKLLPFEFVALEACLEAAISSLEHEASRLELEAHSSLDKFTSKISTLSSERILQIKTRLVAITGRVQQVRDVLEHLLGDDEDMAEMYLTKKLAQKIEDSSNSPTNESDTFEVDLPQGDEDDRLPPEFSLEANRGDEMILQAVDSHDLVRSAHSALSRNMRGTYTSSIRSAMSKKLDVEELEMLLEAYLVQIDSTLNKLLTLKEYVEDTDDNINIMQDDKQNRLLHMSVMVSTATVVMSAFIAVAGVFGMNIHVELFDPKDSDPRRFLWTVIGSSLGSLFLYFGAIGWYKYKRLLE